MQDDYCMELMHALIIIFFLCRRNPGAHTVVNRQWSMEGSSAKKNDLFPKVDKVKTREKKPAGPLNELDYKEKKNKERTIN